MLPAIKELIGRHANDRDENGKLLKRENLSYVLMEMINTRYPKEIPPAAETIQKIISKSRHYKGSALDKPWNMASLTEYPIPHDAIPYILAFKKNDADKPLSIRQAVWIGRLWVLEDETKREMQRLYLTGNDDMSDESLSELADKIRKLTEDYDLKLFIVAGWYCLYERTCEKVGLIPVDTSIFDANSLSEINDKFDMYFYGTKDTEIRDGIIVDKNTGLSVENVDNELERRWKRIKNKDGEASG